MEEAGMREEGERRRMGKGKEKEVNEERKAEEVNRDRRSKH